MAPAISSLSPSARLLQTVLYGGAPFFAYPWKPILNSLYGGDYVGSYKHFRAQHMGGTNLVMHCLCLVWQLSSNYALLGEFDRIVEERFGIKRLITRVTSWLWALHLVVTPGAPAHVKALSVASIFAAQKFAGPFFAKHWHSILMTQGALEALGVQALLLKKHRISPITVGFFAMRMLLWKALSGREGIFKDHSRQINAALMALVAAAASSDNPLIPTILPLALFGWIPALLTGNKLTYFWSTGMMATISQGIAHHFAREAGTLAVLQDSDFDMTKYEFSHVTYFPNLLFQAVSAQISAKR